MLRAIALTLLLFILQSCSAHNQGASYQEPKLAHSAEQVGHMERASHPDAYRHGFSDRPPAHAGQWAVAIIGTPVYLAFKTAVCGATLAIAAPAAAVGALSYSPHAPDVDELGDGVAWNCGPPYVLSPG